MSISLQRASYLLRYKDGKLYWNVKTCRKVVVDAEAGICISNHGYKRIGIDGKVYYVHQIIYLLNYGFIPKCIDHINRNKLDNRIENLREVTFSENCQNINMRKNNSTGYRGISYNKQRKQFVVQKMVNKQSVFGGWFHKLEDAINCLNNINRSMA